MNKIAFALAFVFLLAFAHEAAAQSASSSVKSLNNDDVISMIKSGLANEIVVAKIKSSPAKFDTSPDMLKSLKESGVPSEVILAMIEGNRSEINETDENNGEPSATVFLYRRKEFSTRNLQPSIYVDNSEVARMDDGRFFKIKLEPGKHIITSNKGLSGAAIDMKAGRTYYFRLTLVPGFWKAHSEITLVEKEQGKYELSTMKPLEPKWIKDKVRVSSGPEAN
jgi:hypothetical protein